MAPRTRQHNDPETVYRSETPLRQRKFPPRRQTTRRVTSSARRANKRQSTLTQLDFAKMQPSWDSGEYDDEFLEERPQKRRRRARDSKQQATLTQMDFARVIPASDEDEDEDDLVSNQGDSAYAGSEHNGEHFGDALDNTDLVETHSDNHPDHEWGRQLALSESLLSRRQHRSLSDRPDTKHVHFEPPVSTGPAKVKVENPVTPRRNRVLEVPSSQTPADTPLSTQQSEISQSFYTRSPLHERSLNLLWEPELPRKLKREGVVEPGADQAQRLPTETHIKEEQASLPRSAHPRMVRTNTIQDSEDSSPSLSPKPAKFMPRKAIQDSDAENDTDYEAESDSEQQFNLGAETQAVLAETASPLGDHPQHHIKNEESQLSDDNSVRPGLAQLFSDYDLDSPIVKRQSPVTTLDCQAGRGISKATPASSIQPTFDKSCRPRTRRNPQTEAREASVQPHSEPCNFTQRQGLGNDRYSTTSSKPSRDVFQFTADSGNHSLQETTQAVTQDSSRTKNTMLRNSPQSLPVVLVPSSPVQLPPLSSPAEVAGKSPPSGDLQSFVTISQLLPESLMNYSVPPPPELNLDLGDDEEEETGK